MALPGPRALGGALRSGEAAESRRCFERTLESTRNGRSLFGLITVKMQGKTVSVSG